MHNELAGIENRKREEAMRKLAAPQDSSQKESNSKEGKSINLLSIN